MDLGLLFLACVGLAAVFHSIVVPRLRGRLRGERTTQAVQRAAVLAVADFIRTVAILGAVSFGLAAGLTLILNLSGGDTIEELQKAVDLLETWRYRLSSITSYWGTTVFGLLILGLAVLSHRNAQQRALDAFQERLRVALGELKDRREHRDLENLPSTERMEELSRLRAVLLRHVARLRLDVATPLVGDLSSDTIGQLEEVERYLFILDLERRIDLSWDPDSYEPAAPDGRFARVRNLLVSDGVLTNLGRGSKVLSRAGTLLLFTSLVGVTMPGLGSSIERRIVRLQDLMAHATHGEALASYEEYFAATEDHQPDLLASDDREAVAYLTREFVRAFVQGADIWGRPAQTDLNLRTLRARKQILERASAVRGGQLRILPSLSEAPDLEPATVQMLSRYERAAVEGEPVSKLDELVAARILEASRKSPRAWARLKQIAQKERTRFGSSPGILKVGDLLLAESLGYVVGGVVPDLSGAPARLARSLLKKVAASSLLRLYEIKLLNFLPDLAESRSLTDALQDVGARPSRGRLATDEQISELFRLASDVPTEAALLKELENYSPSLSSAHHTDLDAATRAHLAELWDVRARLRRQAQPIGVADALSSYDDWFPSRETARKETPRWMFLAERDPEVLGLEARRLARAFDTSRVFERLHGSARVGGIVIGQPPPKLDAPILDIRDITWDYINGRVHLQLQYADGRTFDLPDLRRSLIHHALVFVADGRKTAVTVTNVEGLFDRKIHLHPAFVNTPFGCRLTELDQMVYELFESDPMRLQAAEQVRSHIALYRLAWASRLDALLEAGEPLRLYAAFLSPPIVDILRGAERARAEVALDTLAATRALGEPSALADPQLSPLASRTDLFDEEVVLGIWRCRGQGSVDVGAFQSCIRREWSQDARQSLLSGGDELVRWLVPPVENREVSGVRERPFHVDSDFSFLSAPTHGAEPEARLWPFDFLIQVTFTRVGSAQENATEPWVYAGLKDRVPRAVAAHMEQDASARSLLADAREFTLLQRLFRIALSGGLGDRFPQEKLADLAAATGEAVPFGFSTRGWEPSPGRLERVLDSQLESAASHIANPQQEESLEGWLAGARSRIEACSELIRSATAPELIPESMWDERCDLGALEVSANYLCEGAVAQGRYRVPAPCAVRWATWVTRAASAARALRKQFGLIEEYEKARTFRSCPALQ